MTMSTTMLQALADEAGRIKDASDQAARIWVDLSHRAALYVEQMNQLIEQERNAPAFITQHASAAEFQAFQARFFPFAAVSDQPSPGIQPEAQDDEQVKHGSDAATSGERGDAIEQVQSEQVVAETVSGERVAPRNDPETVPEAPPEPSIKDQALDLFAVERLTQREIADRFQIGLSTLQLWLATARRSGDTRAAKGDLLRAQSVEEAKAPAVPAEPYTPPEQPHIHDEPHRTKSPDRLVDIDMDNRVVTSDAGQITVPRHDVRVMLRLADGMPHELETMLQAAGAMTVRSLDRTIDNLNGRLASIGLKITKENGPLYTLKLING